MTAIDRLARQRREDRAADVMGAYLAFVFSFAGLAGAILTAMVRP